MRSLPASRLPTSLWICEAEVGWMLVHRVQFHQRRACSFLSPGGGGQVFLWSPPLYPAAHSLAIPLGRGSGYVSVLHHHSWIAALAPEGDLGLWGKGSSRLTSVPILMSQEKGV